MTNSTPPSSNPELPVMFGAGSHFLSESRLPSCPLYQTAPLATDETPMKQRSGAENCFSRPGFYPSPARNQFAGSISGFRPFPICVCSVFHPWLTELHSPGSFPKTFSPASRFAPLRFSPHALNPSHLIAGAKYSLVVRWLPKIIGYYKLLKAIITWRSGGGVSIWSKITSPCRYSRGGARLPAGHPEFQCYFARF
jgi:hypothetical protein